MSERKSSVVAREQDAGHPARIQRLELKYCERCGALGVQRASHSASAANSGNPFCGACRTSLQWLAGEVQR